MIKIPVDLIANLRYSLRHPTVRLGLVVAVITSTAVLIMTLGYWWPVHHGHELLVGEVKLKRRMVVEAMQAKELASAYRLASQNIVMLEEKLEADSSQAGLVQNVTELARDRGIRILSEAYDEGREENGYVPLHQEIALQGDYSALRRFLMDIHTLPSWTVVQESRFEGSRKQPGRVKATIKLVTYREAPARKDRET